VYQLSRKNTLFAAATLVVGQITSAFAFWWYMVKAIPYSQNDPGGGEPETFFELMHLSDISIMCWLGFIIISAICILFFARGTKLVSAISLLIVVPACIWYSLLWLSRDTFF